MIFSSITFLYYFLPFTLLLYISVPRRARNIVLFAASMVFYAWGEQLLVLLFLLSVMIGWLSGLLMEKAGRYRKWVLFVSAAFHLSLLGYFKYVDFFITNFNNVTGVSIELLHVGLPIGISFYTFQLLSYEIDVFRGDVSAQRSFLKFATYVSMFPQLIAGPIVRYTDVEQSLDGCPFDWYSVSYGIRRFVAGLGKKVLIANQLGEVCTAFLKTGDLSVLYYWMYALFFMLQIYYDFSGYSDMAIGLGRIFGYDFPENFDYPYCSVTITEFWRKWHITLGSWFRDYVYIPLGGNRRGLLRNCSDLFAGVNTLLRQIINIFIVWMLTGLWHGADWNFVWWGIWFAILLILEKLFFKKWLEKHRPAGHLYVLAAVLFGFVLINVNSPAEAVGVYRGMFAFGSLPLWSREALYLLRSYGVLLIVAGFFATPLPAKTWKIIANWHEGFRVVAEALALVGIMLLVTAFLVDGSFNPFLYFRF